MDNLKQKEIDKESRHLILNNTDENYFVEAGAGSGKTTALVGRMVKMIEEDKKIEHISAITFTKAAANEFYDRFQKKLIEKSLENNEYKQKYLDALQNIDLAFMGTIDSFCNMIMSEHPNEGLIPSSAKVIDDDKTKELYAREYANIQNGRYNDEELERKAELFIKYQDTHAKDNFVEVLKAVLNHRDCVLQNHPVKIENIDTKFADEIKTVRKIVRILLDHPEYISSSNNDNIDNLKLALKNNLYVFNGEWDNNVPKIVKAFKDTFLSNKCPFRLYFADEVKNGMGEGIDYFLSHNDKWYEPDEKMSFAVNYIEEVKYYTALDFVVAAKDKILDTLRKEGSLTFSDYLIYLRDTLRTDARNDGKLIKHIYDRHRYFLIDEFQDTDPIQAEIFFYLAAKEIKENWQDCIPHKGSLFIVGDPKQSIYRFKNADVTSYLKIEEMFRNPEVGEVLYLYSNFRSTVETRNWFNETFKELLPKKTKDQAPFENIPIDDNDPYCGEFSGVFKYGVKNGEKDENKVKNIILKICNNENYKIIEKIKGENKETRIISRTIDWKDIMLITPSKPALAKYTKVFRESGIPYFVEGNIKFSESSAFTSFVDCFGAVINPNDNRYLYKVLKSDLYRIKEADISDAVKNGYVLNVLNSAENIPLSIKLSKALEDLRKIAFAAKNISSSSLFAKIMEDIKAFRTFGTENMEYVYFALELLKSKENSKEVVTHNDAFNFFMNLLSPDNEQERCPSLQASSNQVHLANLHKVKGLEAPVVILAQPNGRVRDPNFRMVREPDGNKGYLFNVSKRSENLTFKIINTSAFDDPYKQTEIESADAEGLRLEYVAATRAKNVLIIAEKMTKDGSSPANPWFELLTCASSTNLNDIELVLNSEKATENPIFAIDYDTFENDENELKPDKAEESSKASYELKNPSKQVKNDVLSDLDISEKQQKHVNENNGDSLATITGTIVHRLMELIVLSKDNLVKQDMIDFIINEQVKDEFIEKKEYFSNLLNNIYETMHNGGYFQKGIVVSDILPILLNADQVYSEVPFTYKEGPTVWNGIIDLVYVKDGQIHIIDWKTNKDDNNLDEHYKEQLEAYKKAIEETMSSKVEDALIYHIDISNEGR